MKMHDALTSLTQFFQTKKQEMFAELVADGYRLQDLAAEGDFGTDSFVIIHTPSNLMLAKCGMSIKVFNGEFSVNFRWIRINDVSDLTKRMT